MFTGLYTALITPFKKGKIDERAFQTLIEWQAEEGVQGVVPCGTTGESPTLTYEEHDRVIELAVEAAGGRIQVMAGTGSNSTDEAIRFTRHARKAGADGALIVSPYYNKPTQEGLYQHYKAIALAVNIPIVVYNIPGRSVIYVSDETLERLSKIPYNVVVKDATGEVARVSTLRARVGKKFVQLSGEDMTAVSFNAQGGTGCISVTSNVAPRLCSEVQSASLRGDYRRALELHDKLVPLHAAMFCETSPAPVKYAASLMELCSADVRLPLVAATDATRARMKAEMKKLKLI